jgi:hypothetical protein
MTPIRILSAALIAAALTGALAVPASAGGMVSVNIVPQNKKEEQRVRSGIVLYQYLNQATGNAVVRQKGKNNSAGLRQDGKGNLGVIHQDGKGHNATLDQKGRNNAYGIFQYGRKTDAAVTQKGNGNAGMLIQWGW